MSVLRSLFRRNQLDIKDSPQRESRQKAKQRIDRLFEFTYSDDSEIESSRRSIDGYSRRSKPVQPFANDSDDQDDSLLLKGSDGDTGSSQRITTPQNSARLVHKAKIIKAFAEVFFLLQNLILVCYLSHLYKYSSLNESEVSIFNKIQALPHNFVSVCLLVMILTDFIELATLVLLPQIKKLLNHFTELCLISYSFCVMALAFSYHDRSGPNEEIVVSFIAIYAACSVLYQIVTNNSILQNSTDQSRRLVDLQKDLTQNVAILAQLTTAASFCVLSGFYGLQTAFVSLSTLATVFVAFYLIMDLESQTAEARPLEFIYQSDLEDVESQSLLTYIDPPQKSRTSKDTLIDYQENTNLSASEMILSAYDLLCTKSELTGEQELCQIKSLAFSQAALTDSTLKCLPVLLTCLRLTFLEASEDDNFLLLQVKSSIWWISQSLAIGALLQQAVLQILSERRIKLKDYHLALSAVTVTLAFQFWWEVHQIQASEFQKQWFVVVATSLLYASLFYSLYASECLYSFDPKKEDSTRQSFSLTWLLNISTALTTLWWTLWILSLLITSDSSFPTGVQLCLISWWGQNGVWYLGLKAYLTFVQWKGH